MLLPEWTSQPFPIIGMLHAPPLPGSPNFQGDFSLVRQAVLEDAEALVDGGIHGLMLENYGDTPFYPGRVPAITVAALTALASDIKRRHSVPLGINMLRNDGQSALAVAVATGASFIRVNVLCGARVADQGILQSIAHDLLRERTQLGAKQIQIWADVDVKHSAALAQRSLSDEVHDLIDRGQADAVIVTGSATGQPIDLETLTTVKSAAGTVPVIIGSGANAESLGAIVPFANGVIVGSSLKRDGISGNPIDQERVKRLLTAAQSATRYTSS
jgi:membrane complex biogenesis BtpA family protein